MKTKPKPSAATSTVRKALDTRPKTAPNAPKRVKTRTTPSGPPKTGWIEIETQAPPPPEKRTGIVFGRWVVNLFTGFYGWKETLFCETNSTHWLALPNPPAPKLNKAKQ